MKSGGPWFKSSTLLLSGLVLGGPYFNSWTRWENSQLVSLPPVGIFQIVYVQFATDHKLLRIPTGERLTSWLFTQRIQELNSGLHTIFPNSN